MSSINRMFALALVAAALPAASLRGPQVPGKGEPPLTEQTMKSGGVRPAEQLAVAFDSADLAFELLPDTHVLSGVATLVFTAKAPLARLVIDLDRNLPISAIAIDGKPLPRSAWSNPQGRLTITLPRPLAKGERVTARVTYGGTPHVAVNAPWDDGVVWSKTPDGRTWFATTAEGYGCDLFWPCLDFPTGEPGKVTLHITVPKGLKAPSNGRLLGVDTLADGRTRWNWETKHPNTYAIALNVGPYEEISGIYKSRYGNMIPMFYWYLPGEAAQAKALFAEFAPTLDFFESTIGPYPFGDEKVGVVETPHKGMEHQTINAYGNGYAKAPEGFDWLFQHEFGHEWFGNQLTAANWDDYWLHEGFDTYMQPLYGRWRDGEERYAVMLDTQRNQIANKAPIVRDRVMTEEEVYEPTKGGAGTDIYYKASWMLHTLRWLIGDRAFFDATRRLVYGRPDPKPGNFTPRYGSTREFEGIVRQVTGKDYRWFFDAYLRQAALPVLDVTRTASGYGLVWRAMASTAQVTTTTPFALSLSKCRSSTSAKVKNGASTSSAQTDLGQCPQSLFPMPIEVAIDGRSQRVAMTNGRGFISAPPAAHIVIDPMARVLRGNPAVDAFQAWKVVQTEKDSK